jgi:hypothetical protein
MIAIVAPRRRWRWSAPAAVVVMVMIARAYDATRVAGAEHDEQRRRDEQ